MGIHKSVGGRWRTGVLALIVAGGVIAASPALADWPQWRGPKRDGVSPEKNLLGEFPREGPKELWRSKVGTGYSAVSVTGGVVYTMGWENGKDRIVALDAATGKEKWAFDYQIRRWNNMHEGGPSSTPAVADGRVFTVSREADLYCIDAKTGQKVWSHGLRKEAGLNVPQWGFSGSALVVGDKVYVDVGRTIAFEAATGKPVWQTKDYGGGYSSPVQFKHKDKDLLAVFPGAGLVILDRATGNEIATFNWKTSYDVNASTPIILDDHILIGSGYGVGSALVKFDGTKLTQVWQSKNMRTQMNTCVVANGFAYGFDDAILKCLDVKTGDVKWQERGLGNATVAMGDGKLYVLSERGELVVAPASPEGFNPAGKVKLFNTQQQWTVPVISDGVLYARSREGEVVALDIKAK